MRESAFSFYLPIYSHYVTLIYSPFAKALDAKEPTLKSFHITHPHSISHPLRFLFFSFSRPPSCSSHRASSLIAIHLFIYLYDLAISFPLYHSIRMQRIQYSQRLKKFLLLKRVFKLHLKLEHRHSRQYHLWTKNPKLYIIYTVHNTMCYRPYWCWLSYSKLYTIPFHGVPCLYRLKTHKPTSIPLNAYVCVCVRAYVCICEWFCYLTMCPDRTLFGRTNNIYYFPISL